MDHAVILAGGSGTRLWPVSRKGMPKQLLTLIGGRSLLQLAYERALTVVDPQQVVVCAGRAYADVVAQQLPTLPPDNLLAEPVGRDSLAAITWSSAVIAERDADAVVAVLTADHLIAPQERFTEAVRAALAAARGQSDALVTLGVVPSQPHTGYGYLKIGSVVDEAALVHAVDRFVEKPDRALAEQYLAEGGWRWNSGMFCWRPALFLDQVRALQPSLAAGIDALVAEPERLDEIYPGLTKISVDYGIMEPISQGQRSTRIVAVNLEADWVDIGGFPALVEQCAQPGCNLIEGQVVELDSAGNLLLNRSGEQRLLAVAGLTRTIVVMDDDVTLVCPIDDVDSIRGLVDLARSVDERFV